MQNLLSHFRLLLLNRNLLLLLHGLQVVRLLTHLLHGARLHRLLHRSDLMLQLLHVLHLLVLEDGRHLLRLGLLVLRARLLLSLLVQLRLLRELLLLLLHLVVLDLVEAVVGDDVPHVGVHLHLLEQRLVVHLLIGVVLLGRSMALELLLCRCCVGRGLLLLAELVHLGVERSRRGERACHDLRGLLLRGDSTRLRLRLGLLNIGHVVHLLLKGQLRLHLILVVRLLGEALLGRLRHLRLSRRLRDKVHRGLRRLLRGRLRGRRLGLGLHTLLESCNVRNLLLDANSLRLLGRLSSRVCDWRRNTAGAH